MAVAVVVVRHWGAFGSGAWCVMIMVVIVLMIMIMRMVVVVRVVMFVVCGALLGGLRLWCVVVIMGVVVLVGMVMVVMMLVVMMMIFRLASRPSYF